jgi:predicted alpha-1,2-mannosidase
MYNWAGKPWKTADRIHEIMNTKYLNKPDGLCGNDDCGQMSAWYIFSSLGFYPVCPGSGEYVIGSPSVNEATIDLENGKKLRVLVKNGSAKSIYIKSVTINGQACTNSYIKHSDIAEGGELVFEMSRRPNKRWATDENAYPYSNADVLY